MDTVMGNLLACSPAMRVAVANRIEALARTREWRGSRVTVVPTGKRVNAAVGADARAPLASLGALLVLQELLKQDHCMVPAAAALAAIVTTPTGAFLEAAIGKSVVDSEVLPLLVRLMQLPNAPVVEHCAFVVRKVSSNG